MGIPIGNKQWKLRKLFSNTGNYAYPSSSSIPLIVVVAGIDTPNEYITVGSGRYKIVALFNEFDSSSGGTGFSDISVLAGNTPEDLSVVHYFSLNPTGFENVISKNKFSISKVIYNKLTNQFLLFFVNPCVSNTFLIFKSSNLTSFTQLKLNTSSTISNFFYYNRRYAYQQCFYYNNNLIDHLNEPAVNNSYIYVTSHIILLNSKVNGYDLLFLYNDAQYLVDSSSGSYMKITDTFVPVYTAGYTGCLYNPVRNELIFASPKEICQIALTDIPNFNTKVKRTTLSGNVVINNIIQNGNYIYGASFNQHNTTKFFESRDAGSTWTDYTSNYKNSKLLENSYGEYNYTSSRKIDGKWITTQGDNDRFMQSRCHSLDFNSAQDQIIFNMGDSDATSIKFSMPSRRAYQYGLIYSPYNKSYFYLLGGAGTAGFGILYAHDSYVTSVSVSPNGTKITASGTGSISKSVTWRISSLNYNKRKRKIA